MKILNIIIILYLSALFVGCDTSCKKPHYDKQAIIDSVTAAIESEMNPESDLNEEDEIYFVFDDNGVLHTSKFRCLDYNEKMVYTKLLRWDECKNANKFCSRCIGSTEYTILMHNNNPVKEKEDISKN